MALKRYATVNGNTAVGIRISFGRQAMVQYARHLYNRDESLNASQGSDQHSSDEDTVETSTLSNRKLHRNKLRLVEVKAAKLTLSDEQVSDLLSRIQPHVKQLLIEGCIRIDKEGYNKVHRRRFSCPVESGSWKVNLVVRPETCRHFQELRFGHLQSESAKGPSLFTRELYFDTSEGPKTQGSKPSGVTEEEPLQLFLSDEEDTAKENLRVRYQEFQYLRGDFNIEVIAFPL